MSEALPELLDAKRLQAELGVTRAAVEAIMRRLPVVQIEDLRRCTSAAPTWWPTWRRARSVTIRSPRRE